MAGVFVSSRPGLGEIRQSVEEGVPTSRFTRVVVMAVLAVGLSADVAASRTAPSSRSRVRRTRMRPTTLLLSRFGSSDRCITERIPLSATVLPVRGTAAESGWPRQRRRWRSARRAPTILLHGLPRIRVQRSEGRSAGHGPQARDSRRSQRGGRAASRRGPVGRVMARGTGALARIHSGRSLRGARCEGKHR